MDTFLSEYFSQTEGFCSGVQTSNLVLYILALMLIPLISATVIACFLRRCGNLAATLSVVSAFLMAIFALLLVSEFNFIQATTGQSFFIISIPWLDWGATQFEIGCFLDSKASMMLAVVTFVAFWIHLFSLGYMKKDTGKARYFGGLSIFMFSMMGIILANNLIMLFIFWELVGFSSYMLIAHYYDTDFASWASKKAFIANRVGDFGFIIGIIATYMHYGTVNLPELMVLAQFMDSGDVTWIGLLLMCGFLGKSAQFPLHVWLPDAMAGPTPVSALIHAATMVAAGIYFMARIFFLLSLDVQMTVFYLASFMIIFAGLLALAQTDIKKILAYSTLAQLGYMAVALGLGLPALALFHMTTHAFFKALLFLSAGSVIHALHHEQDIFKMGGLYKRMPITTLCFTIGTLALCGVTYTSGYFSKDAIIEAALLHGKVSYAITMLGAILTSLYMGRLLWIAFFGKPKSHSAAHAKESSFVMILPLLVLAFFSLTAGWVKYWPLNLNAPLMETLHFVHESIHIVGVESSVKIATFSVWIIGLTVAFFFYKPGASQDRLESLCWPLYSLLKSKFWFDEIYNGFVKYVQQRVADLLAFLDLILISGFLVRGSAGVLVLCSMFAKYLHTGSIQVYVYWFAFGLFLFVGFAMSWF